MKTVLSDSGGVEFVLLPCPLAVLFTSLQRRLAVLFTSLQRRVVEASASNKEETAYQNIEPRRPSIPHSQPIWRQ